MLEHRRLCGILVDLRGTALSGGVPANNNQVFL